MARIKLIAAMLILGTLGLFVQYIPLSAHLTVFIRAVVATSVMGIVLLLRKQRLRLPRSKKSLCLLLLSGACMAMNFLFLFEAYKRIPYSIASLCDYFAPVVIMALAPIVYREKQTLRQMGCCIMCTVGLILLVGVGGVGHLDSVGVAIGLIGMLFYVPVLVINKIIKDVGSLERTFLQFGVAALVLAAMLPFGEKPDFSQMQLSGWLHLFVIGAVHTGLAYYLSLSALPKLPGQEGALLTYIDPLTAICVSLLWMGETLNGIQILGGVLLLGFLILNEFGTAHPEHITKHG